MQTHLSPEIPELTKVQASFQQRVHPWLMNCFGPATAADHVERNHRFLEEALETVQSCGCTAAEAHQLVDYVFNRPVGEPHQEVGGVMVTLAALCLAQRLDMHRAGEDELQRIWPLAPQILAKQIAKPRFSALPEGPLAGGERLDMVVAPALVGGLLTRPAQIDVDEFIAGSPALAVIEAAQAFHAAQRSPGAAARRDHVFIALGRGLKTIEDLPDDEPAA